MSGDQVRGKSEHSISQTSVGLKRRDLLLSGTSLVAASALLGAGFATSAQAQQPARTPPSGKQPNILVIMGDDVGWFNIGAYHRGIMSGKTPNLDKLVQRGTVFTRAYCMGAMQGAVCVPSRAMVMSGRLQK